jgi:hypothetical protein
VQPVFGLVPDRAVGRVEDLVGDLVAAVGGQAVQRDRARPRAGHQRRVDLQRAEGRRAVEAVVLLAHRHPRVGDDDVRTLDGGVRIGHQLGPAPGLGAAGLGVAQHLRIGLEALRCADPHGEARRGAAEQQRVGHVVRPVAQVDQRAAGEVAEALADREQVGEDLAGVELVGERVDHRHGGACGHLLDARLVARAPDDGIDVAGQHAGGVGDGLAAAELARLRVDDHRGAAELGDAHLERDAGAGAGLVEQHRHRLRARQGPLPVRIGLQRDRQLQHLGLLGRAEVIVAQEVPRHARRPGSRAAR